MGMCTTIYLEAKLSLDLLENIAFALQNHENYEVAVEKKLLPKNNFFQCDHADSLMYKTTEQDKIFIDYKNTSVQSKGLNLEKKSTYWSLSVATCLKNYEQEIQKFLDLISEYVVDAKDDEILGKTFDEYDIRKLIKYKNIKLLLEHVEKKSEDTGYGYLG